MAGSIPPLVSSSPPPLCAFDDDDEEEEDEFGMYTAAEEIDYTECVSFKEKDEEKQSGVKSRAEQDSTSQDSATDSGLCPDSEGMSPTPHSDDERIVKQNMCDRLCLKPSELPVLSNRLALKCDSEHSECLDKVPEILETSICTGLPNGYVDVNHSTTTESDDDFGNFENFESVSIPDLQLTEQGTSQNTDSNLKSLEMGKCLNLEIGTEDNENFECDKTLDIPSVQVDEFDETKEVSNSETVVLNFESENSFSCEFPTFEQESCIDCQETQQNSITSNDTILLENNQAAELKSEIQLEIPELESEVDDFDDFTDFKSNFCNSLDIPDIEQSDKTSEHPKQFSDQDPSEDVTKSLQLPQQDESDEEFSNFADFSSSDCAFVSAQSSNSLENVSHIPFKSCDDTDIRTDNEFQDWVSVFPSDGPDPTSESNITLLKDDDVVWTRLFPLESSPALAYQWTDSLANRRLLSALNIDSRNILFMPWSNSAVPRFAANLSCGPLEPVKATEPLQLAPQPTTIPQPVQTHCSTQESVPDAHFDWVSSGLTNPLDYPKPVLNLPKTLSTEAENILSSLPDLLFMKKTYIDFPINEG